MKILFIARDLPYPATNGYKKRNFFLLKELAKRNIEVVLYCRDSLANQKESMQALKSLCKEVIVVEGSEKDKGRMSLTFISLFSGLPFSVKIRTFTNMRKEVEKYLRNNSVDILICDSVYWSLNIPLNNRFFKILYEHNIESMIYKRYLAFEKNIFKKFFAFIEYLKLENFQRRIWKKFDACVVCSSFDKKIMEEKNKSKNSKVYVINNGVDSSYFAADSYPLYRDSLVYTGQIGWHPNEDALIYFLKNIYPLIKRDRPQATFWIVGGEPSGRLKLLTKNDKSVIITGFVEDVRPYIGEACVFVVPLRIGSGTRLKILEALSMQKAVVSTSVGCEGLDVENNKHLLIRDNPEEFAEAVVQLLRDGGRRINLGENGRRLVEEKYDWNVVFGRLDEVLNKVKISGD